MMRTRPGAVGASEEEYIAREEADREREYALDQRQIAAGLAEKAHAEAQERAKQAHVRRCPECATPLHGEALRGVQVDRCRTCGGVWTGRGQLDRLTRTRSGFLHGLAGLFRTRDETR